MTRMASRLFAVGMLLATASALAAEPAPKVPAPRPIVAVLYFDVFALEPALQVFNKGLAQMLITDLAALPELQLVERSRLEEVMGELKLQHTQAFDQKTSQQLGQLLGAKYQVAGSVVALGSKLALNAQVRRVQTGEFLTTAKTGSLKVVKSAEEIFELEQELVLRIAEVIATAEASGAPPPAKHTGKLKLGTAVKYAQALDLLDKKDKPGAKAKLQDVVKEQPDFLLASLDLDKLVK